jgi:A/G-specific adenine glycosylase
VPRPLSETVLEWSAGTRRDLPWRRTRDPWAVLVSELMLQQTQVARVLPLYERFLERFPKVGDCASAPVGEIIRLWAGLGYNRRAVNLHRCAVAVVERHGGVLPDSLDALLALPGIGPYTARAVLAFAFERDVAVVDTNVGRVLARWEGRSLRPKEVQAAADAVVPLGAGWAWNQAMLDLGATVCRKRAPQCGSCPVAGWCAWGQAGCPDPDPAVGSAAVAGGQSRFEGSDRQGRGRLVDELRRVGAVPVDRLAAVCGWPDDHARARAAADSLVADGLAAWSPRGRKLTLPR